MPALALEITTAFEIGTVLFGPNVKLNELGSAERGLGPGELAFSSTRTARVPPGELMFMNPSSVVATARAGLTLTVSCTGVVPLAGETDNQWLLEEADTVMLVGPVVDVIVSDCETGVTPVALKVSWGGVGTSV